MLFSKQDLSRIIVPLLLQQTLAITVGMLDSVMVSSAGEAAVSGVSLVNTVNNLLVYVFSALASGGAVVISQSLGCKNFPRAKAAAKQLIWAVFFAALLVTTLAVVFRNTILSLIFGSIPAEIMQNAQVYFLYTALSYPFLGIHNACSAIFRAEEIPKYHCTHPLSSMLSTSQETQFSSIHSTWVLPALPLQRWFPVWPARSSCSFVTAVPRVLSPWKLSLLSARKGL